MEARILELIQHPENISAEDIAILQKEISKYPYMQSLRTLQLSAVHHFDAENYQKELTKTAAYTTDKKILYQFINKKDIEQKKEAAKFKKTTLVKHEEAQEKPIEEKTLSYIENEIPKNEEPKILPFEIEQESFVEAPFKTRQEDLNYTKETILDQFDKISDKEEDLPAVKPSDISFNGFDSFLPDVKFTVPSAKSTASPIIEPPAQEEIPQPEIPKEQIDFQNVQSFTVEETPVSKIETKEEVKVVIEPVVINEEKPIVEEKLVEIITEPEVHFEWKPMNFINNPLDSQIQKQVIEKPKPVEKIVEVKPEIIEAKIELVEPEPEKQAIVEKAEEIVEDIKAEEIAEEKQEEVKEEPIESNIPNFVNTWQSWLKIDRTETPKVETIEPERIIEKKAEIIDKFIEENPRISQLKEESSYVVKEKTDDISHLMTETLAKLYIEQKLYSKAIKAYEVLQKKHPEKQEEFKGKIKEIKTLRQNK